MIITDRTSAVTQPRRHTRWCGERNGSRRNRPYTYDWSNGAATQTATGVGAGTYSVTVTDANGCVSTSTVTVTEPTVLGSTASVASNYNGEDIACNGGSNGSASVAPTGGTVPYTYD